MTQSSTPANANALLLTNVSQLLYRGIPTAVIFNGILAAALAWLHWHTFYSEAVFTWLFFLGACLALRSLSHYFFSKTAQQNHFFWLFAFRACTLLTASCWGLASYLLYEQATLTDFSLYTFVIAGICAAAMTSLAIDKISTLCFILPCLCPMVLYTFQRGSDEYIAMGVMLILFGVFTLISAARIGANLHENILLRLQQTAAQNQLQDQQKISELVAQIQAQFISDENRQAIFSDLLNHLLNVTQSEYGFIGEVLYTKEQQPYLKTHAITNIAWNESTHKFYAEQAPEGLEFTNLRSLFGWSILVKQPIISNNPATDERAGGLPEGHPPLNAFLGVPIMYQDNLVAMIGLANKCDGYTEHDIVRLKPINDCIGQLVFAARAQAREKAIEIALAEEAAHTQAIIQSMEDGLITTNEKGMITRINSATERIFGYSTEQLIGKNIGCLLQNDKQDYDLLDHLVTNKINLAGTGTQIQGKRSDNSFFPLEVSIAETIQKNEKLFILIFRDITERSRLEKLKEEFVSTVSHELRTPLTAIKGALGVICGGALAQSPELAQGMLTIAYKNSQRLSVLINDLLDMEKLIAGKMNFLLAPESVDELANQAMEDNAEFAKTFNINLALNNTTKNQYLSVEKLRFQQIMSNLISNAVKFSPKEATVTLHVEQHETIIRFTVEDAGTGVPEEFRSRIFQKFSQADSSDSRQKNGSGLGLAITKELTERMYGHIGFDSAPGQGARFYIEFPVAQATV